VRVRPSSAPQLRTTDAIENSGLRALTLRELGGFGRIADCTSAAGAWGSFGYCIWWQAVIRCTTSRVNEQRRVRVSDSGAIRSRLVLASERSATESNTREADLSPRRNMIAPWWQRHTNAGTGTRVPQRGKFPVGYGRSWSCGPLRANDVGRRPGRRACDNALVVGIVAGLRPGPMLRIDHAVMARAA
jgi:hypothetical protein